jgi:hypothetical protein
MSIHWRDSIMRRVVILGGRDPLEMSDIVVSSSRVFKNAAFRFRANPIAIFYRVTKADLQETRHFLFKQSNSKFAGMVLYLAPTHVLNSRLITPIKSPTTFL